MKCSIFHFFFKTDHFSIFDQFHQIMADFFNFSPIDFNIPAEIFNILPQFCHSGSIFPKGKADFLELSIFSVIIT